MAFDYDHDLSRFGKMVIVMVSSHSQKQQKKHKT